MAKYIFLISLQIRNLNTLIRNSISKINFIVLSMFINMAEIIWLFFRNIIRRFVTIAVNNQKSTAMSKNSVRVKFCFSSLLYSKKSEI